MIASSPLHLILAATLTASPAVNPSTCGPTDHRCTAEANVAAARTATSDSERTHRLYRAHRAYLALAQKAAPAEHARLLCRAAELLGQAQALPPQESLRQLLVTTARETTDALAGIDCSPMKRPKGAGRRVAKRTASTPAISATADRQNPPSASESAAALLAVPVRRPAADGTASAATRFSDTVGATPGDLASSNRDDSASTTARASKAPPSSTLAIDQDPRGREVLPVSSRPAPARPGRGLVIAGGITLGAGVALLAAAGVLGYRMSETRKDVLALDGMLDGFASEAEAAKGDALVHDYRVMRSQTLALALTSSATVVVAAILAGIGAKRMARRASRAALVPAPGGLVFRGRF